MKHPMQFIKTVLVSAALSTAAFSAHADSYEDGLMAYAVGNYAEAGQHFMSAAEQGNAGAEHMLMRLFSEGKLFATNMDKETLKWTKKAAEKGLMQAQFALAEIYTNKQGDTKAAVEWYRKAAQQGHPDAYYQLGAIYEDGTRGVSADSETSTRMYQIAASEFDVYAQKGHADYQYQLAGMYQHAKGVSKNMKLALKWLEKSAMQGHAMAQLSLGRLYAHGLDVPKDVRLAAYWLNLAAAQGVVEANTILSKLHNEEDSKLALFF